MNSCLLFNNQLSLKCSIRCNFSAKDSGQKLIFLLLRENCPLQNHCLMPSLIYRADVENDANKGTKIYFGLAETSFKCGL